jgi:hypothetical protein
MDPVFLNITELRTRESCRVSIPARMNDAHKQINWALFSLDPLAKALQ